MNDLVTWLREQIAETERVAKAASAGGSWRYADGDSVGAWTLYDEHWTIASLKTYRHDEYDYSARMPAARHPRYVDADANGAHIARHDPAAVLAQCEAHERVLERHRRPRMDDSGESWMEPNSCAGCGVTGATDLPRADDINDCPELRDMALAYQHRPGYRQEWRP